MNWETASLTENWTSYASTGIGAGLGEGAGAGFDLVVTGETKLNAFGMVEMNIGGSDGFSANWGTDGHSAGAVVGSTIGYLDSLGRVMSGWHTAEDNTQDDNLIDILAEIQSHEQPESIADEILDRANTEEEKNNSDTDFDGRIKPEADDAAEEWDHPSDYDFDGTIGKNPQEYDFDGTIGKNPQEYDFEGDIGAPLIPKNDKRNTTENIDYLNGEREVSDFLAEVVKNSDNYEIKAYERKALGEGKRTPLRTHTLYVITDINTGEETTLSFNTTGKNILTGAKSTGAWAINTKTDVDSYENYKYRNNSYDMQRYDSGNIDVKATAGSIINLIGTNNKYYFRDHIKDKLNYNNCNTAVYDTIKFKKN